MVQSQSDDPTVAEALHLSQVLETAKAIRRASTIRAGGGEERFGPGAHCVICGNFGRWDAASGVTLCQRHLDAIGRGEL